MVNRTNFETINIDDFNHDPINQERVQSYPPELVGRFNSFIVTAFDDSMTVEMQLRTLIKWIKENIDVTMSALDNMEAFKQDSMAFQNHVKNTLVNLINNFTDQFDDNLKFETQEILNQWIIEGILSDLIRNAINEEVVNARGGKDSLGERLDETDLQLSLNSKDISSQWLNVMTPPAGFSVPTADGITDDSEKVNALINYAYSLPNKPAVVIPKSLGISQSIICKEGVDLVFTNNAKLTARDDVNVIVMARDMTLKNPRIYTGEVSGFSHAAIFIHGNQYIKTMVQRTIIDSPIIWGGSEGYGIHFYSGDVANQAVSYVQVKNAYVHTFYKGVFMESSGVSETWITGNIFTSLLMSGNTNDLWIEAGGNIFNGVEIQPQSFVEKENTIYCSNESNNFNSVMAWDSHYGFKIKLTEKSRKNYFDIISGSHPIRVTDLGVDNKVVHRDYPSFEFNKTMATNVRYANIDNFLSLAHERFSVTQTQGSTPTAYVLENAFIPYKSVRWNPSSTFPIQIEITLDKAYHDFVAFGVDFTGTPSSVKIEVFNSKTNKWMEWYNNPDNHSKSIRTNKNVSFSEWANNVTKILITFSGSRIVEDVGINDIWAISNTNTGYVYYPRTGGLINGKVLAQDGLGVGNFDQTITQGAEVGKFRVFDENGNPIGYVPVFSS